MGLSREESISKYGTERYTGWNEPEAGYDAAALGYSGSGSEGGKFADLIAQLIASQYELPYNLKSFEEYEAMALEELRPYYERLLKEEGGDVERAKLRLGQDYERGMRINREDYEKAKTGQGEGIKPGETTQDYYNRTKKMFGTFPEEGINLLDTTARRGMLDSGFAKIDTAKLATSQQRRQEAIKQASERYAEQAGITKGRGLEDVGTAWDRRQFELGEQKKKEAGIMGRQKRADEESLQQIERDNLMRKAIQNLYG